MVDIELKFGERYMYAGTMYQKGNVYKVSNQVAKYLLSVKTPTDIPCFARVENFDDLPDEPAEQVEVVKQAKKPKAAPKPEPVPDEPQAEEEGGVEV